MGKRVLIIADQGRISRDLRRFIESDGLDQVVAESADPADAVHSAEALAPDLVLVDLGLTAGGALRVAELIAERCPTATVVIMSVFECAEYRRAAEVRALGYLAFVDLLRELSPLLGRATAPLLS